MDRVALNLGFIQIYWYSLFIFIAMTVASLLIYKEAKKKKINEEFLVNLIFYTIIIGILGARAYYVLFNFSYYITNPIEIIEIWNGGLAIHGGIIAATLFICYYCKKNKVNLIDILDIAVIGLIIAQAIGRWGNFCNGEAYGQITTATKLSSIGIPKFIIDGMYILGEYRQPTFLYESLWCFLGFLVMILIRRFYKKLKKGQLSGFYLVWYGSERLIIEYFRSDSLMLGTIKIAQLMSILFIILGIYLFTRYKNNQEEKYLYSYKI